MEKTGYDVRNVSDGRTHLVLVWRKIFLWALSGINTVLFLVCVLCICIFFVTILCTFFVNYSPTQIRNTFVPNLGIWSFFWNKFYTYFTFHNVWCVCSNCLFIDKIKLFLCFEKFYNIFLSLIAVYKNPTYNRWLSPGDIKLWITINSIVKHYHTLLEKKKDHTIILKLLHTRIKLKHGTMKNL